MGRAASIRGWAALRGSERRVCWSGGAASGASKVTQYLSSQANSAGFDKIIAHESKFKHFKANGEPVKSFDNGYGMCQLTTPVPSFAQVWSWKENIGGGLKLFEQKRVTAVTYLSQSKRTYTAEQLKYETVCRWNVTPLQAGC